MQEALVILKMTDQMYTEYTANDTNHIPHHDQLYHNLWPLAKICETIL